MADPNVKRVQDALDQLGEHFDTVMIFVTLHSGNDVGTIAISRGSGNWYARYGQVQEWIVKENANSVNELNNEGT